MLQYRVSVFFFVDYFLILSFPCSASHMHVLCVHNPYYFSDNMGGVQCTEDIVIGSLFFLFLLFKGLTLLCSGVNLDEICFHFSFSESFYGNWSISVLWIFDLAFSSPKNILSFTFFLLFSLAFGRGC